MDKIPVTARGLQSLLRELGSRGRDALAAEVRVYARASKLSHLGSIGPDGSTITAGDWFERISGFIRARPGREILYAEIVARLGCAPRTLSGAVARMERSGLALRVARGVVRCTESEARVEARLLREDWLSHG